MTSVSRKVRTALSSCVLPRLSQTARALPANPAAMIAKRERIITPASSRISETSGSLPDSQRAIRERTCAGSTTDCEGRATMFEKGMDKSIRAYLEPGEELLAANIVQGKGLGKVALAGGV